MHTNQIRPSGFRRVIFLVLTALLVLAVVLLPVAFVFFPAALSAAIASFFFLLTVRALPLAAVRVAGSSRSPPLFS
jgi:E3 ubiquitin-protein ligase DOA10